MMAVHRPNREPRHTRMVFLEVEERDETLVLKK